jgi:hypothetical protein
LLTLYAVPGHRARRYYPQATFICTKNVYMAETEGQQHDFFIMLILCTAFTFPV